MNLWNIIGVLLFAVGGYIGATLYYYALVHYSSPEFSIGGTVVGVCIAVGYLFLKEENKKGAS